MRFSIYFLLLLILSVNGWDLVFLEPIMNNQIGPFIGFLLLIIGIFWFGKIKISLTWFFASDFSIYFWLIHIGVFLSFFTAYFYWGQDFLTSFIVNRHFIWLLFLPFIFYVNPTYKELITSFNIYTIFYIVVWIIQFLSPLPITVSMLNKLEIGTYNGVLLDSEFGYLIPGYQLVLITFYFHIFRLKESPNFRLFLICTFLIVFIFLLQNRGILIFALPVYFYSFIKFRGKGKFFGLIGILLIGFFFINSTFSIWQSLFDETLGQIENKDYNRWKSFYFFLFDYSPSLLCDLFGNGFLSLTEKGGEYIYRQKLLGYYQSDLGIIGLWSLYGLLTVSAVYLIVFRIIFGARLSFFLKVLSLHILFIPIAWNFSLSEIFILICMIYFYSYERKMQFKFQFK